MQIPLREVHIRLPGAGQAPHITSNCRKAFRDVLGAVFVTLVLLLLESEFDARSFMGSPFEVFHLSEVRLPGNSSPDATRPVVSK